jgi:hypothetical protein
METPVGLARFSEKELELIKAMDCLEYAEDAKICDVYHKMALDAFASNRSDSVADSVRRCFNALFDGPIQLSNGKYLHHGTPEFDNLISI